MADGVDYVGLDRQIADRNSTLGQPRQELSLAEMNECLFSAVKSDYDIL